MICLCMIVKDEADTIERCLQSVVGLIDYYVIHDTGSTDGTPDKILSLTTELGLRGEVTTTPWVNFGHNRTLALKRAQEVCRIDEPKSPTHSWVLLLDADWALNHPNSKGAVKELSTDVDWINISSDDKATWHKVFINPLIPWTYEGEVHEVLTPHLPTDPSYSFKSINSKHMNWTHHHDGGGHNPYTVKDRWYDDLRILRTKQDPTPRDLYYLAQTYQCLGLPHLAKEIFLRRAARTDGFWQEVYLSLLYAGRIALNMDKTMEALGLFTRAYLRDPSRYEAAAEMCTILRNNESPYGVLQIKLSDPHGDVMQPEVYMEQAYKFEQALAHQHMGNRAKAYQKYTYLLGLKDLDPGLRTAIELNMKYMEKSDGS